MTILPKVPCRLPAEFSMKEALSLHQNFMSPFALISGESETSTEPLPFPHYFLKA